MGSPDDPPAAVEVFWSPRHRLAPRPSWCSEAELVRAGSMLPSVGDGWLAARSWVRERLAEVLDVSPRQVELQAERTGRPFLGPAHGSDAPQLSISHSASTVVLAVGPTRLGVDVEDLPEDVPDLLGLAEVVATPAELVQLAAADPAALPTAFQLWWTRKEAVLKAAGEGFLRDPRTCHVGVGPVAEPPSPWRVHELGEVWGAGRPVLCVATHGPAVTLLHPSSGP